MPILTLLATLVATTSGAGQEQAAAPAHAAGTETPAAAAQAAAPGFTPPTFADDTVMYVFGPNYRNPFITTPSQPDGADISRHAIEFKHVDAWKYGHNLADVVIKKSSEVEPAVNGGDGAVGFYGIFRTGVGINRLAGKRVIALGPLRDIDIQGGFNLETKNSDFAPAERTLYFGPNLQFGVGQGFINVATQLRKEWNHDGNLGVKVEYDLGVNAGSVWHLPFSLGGVKVAFDGFADYNTAKGKDAAGRDTRPEFITRPLLKVDISPLVGQKARVLEAGAGFQYWHNMFGKNADRVPGAKEFTPVFVVAVHLPMGTRGAGH